jgi:hypothetical protein
VESLPSSIACRVVAGRVFSAAFSISKIVGTVVSPGLLNIRIAAERLRLEVDVSGNQQNRWTTAMPPAKLLALLRFDGDGAPGAKTIVGDALLVAVTVYIMAIVILT